MLLLFLPQKLGASTLLEKAPTPINHCCRQNVMVNLEPLRLEPPRRPALPDLKENTHSSGSQFLQDIA